MDWIITESPLVAKVWSYLTYKPDAPLIFSSPVFLFLFLAFYAIYAGAGNRIGFRTFYTTLFSVYFYYKSSGIYVLLLLFSTAIDFSLGLLIEGSREQWKKKAYLVLSLCANLGMLAYFKYTNFLIENLNYLFALDWEKMDIFLPAGVSFFVFQTLSYTIDVYKGHIPATRNLLDFAFFVTYFPQLVAGPIVRAADFLPQIHQQLHVGEAERSRGLLLIIGGLFKKAVISDYIAVNMVDRVFDNPGLFSGFEILTSIYGYALQIYCDFSGYSDMAIGLALIMGFTLVDNFRSPYKSTSITDFWRRWHISLSSWLRDYLYIPLGGNRMGKFRQYINLMLTMLLGGLWHGASWKFVIWGGLHGGGLALEKALDKGDRQAAARPWKKALGWLITFHFVCFCWIFFRANTWTDAVLLLNRLVTDFNPQIIVQVLRAFPEVYLLMLAGYFLHFLPARADEITGRMFLRSPLVLKSLLLAITMWIVIQTMTAEVKPFIYFQF